MIPINHKKYIIISYTNNKICNMIRKDSICYNINTDNECIVLKYYKKYNMKYELWLEYINSTQSRKNNKTLCKLFTILNKYNIKINLYLHDNIMENISVPRMKLSTQLLIILLLNFGKWTNKWIHYLLS